MNFSVRYVLAGTFVLLWWLMPEPDHARLGLLQARGWLNDAVLPAFQTQSPNGDAPSFELPPLRVSVRIASDVIPDSAQRAVRSDNIAQELSRLPRSFARAQKAAELTPDASPLDVRITVGSKGFRADLSGNLPPGHREASNGSRFFERIHRFEGDPATLGYYYPDQDSLLPAFVAIVLAILFGKVVVALLAGSLIGAWWTVGRPGWHGVGAPLDGARHLAVDTIGFDVLRSEFNIEVLAFVLFLFMAIGVMTRSGGVQGLADRVRRFARNAFTTQLAAFAIGVLIFFDDYANCVITGTTMRPLADRNRVAREKLAYIVDSTAAPIAGISIFSTWVAYEISTFAPQLPEVTRADGSPFEQSDGFAVFISTLSFRFYCFLTLAMVLLTIVLRRDFGPMAAAQRRAAEEGKPYADDAKPMLSQGFEQLAPEGHGPFQAIHALLPLGLLVVATITGILALGWMNSPAEDLAGAGFGETLRTLLDNTESQRALWIASLIALVAASMLALGGAGLSVGTVIGAALRAARGLGFAMVILVFAWTIGQTCSDLGTAQYLTAAFQGRFPEWMLPSVMFLLASLVSFSTGTSYGTMAILLPNVIVLAHATGESAPNLTGEAMMYMTIGAVLEGSIFGDHCSPISDTTVLSSVGTGSDHLHHVRTQAPYAIFVMAIAILGGYLPMAWFGTEWLQASWFGALVVIAATLLVFGRRHRA